MSSPANRTALREEENRPSQQVIASVQPHLQGAGHLQGSGDLHLPGRGSRY